jgi:hypothetical protein
MMRHLCLQPVLTQVAEQLTPLYGVAICRTMRICDAAVSNEHTNYLMLLASVKRKRNDHAQARGQNWQWGIEQLIRHRSRWI